MKNIQIIDGAENCAYDIFEASDVLFDFIFSGGKDISFFEDLNRSGINNEMDKEFSDMWGRPLKKKKVRGIDGTLFYELYEKSQYYPNRKESDLDLIGRGFIIDQAGK